MILLKRPWTQKPPQPVRVNTAHHLGKKVLHFAYFAEKGAGIFDAATGNYFSESSYNLNSTKWDRVADAMEGLCIANKDFSPNALKLFKEHATTSYLPLPITILGRFYYGYNVANDRGFFFRHSFQSWADGNAGGLRPGCFYSSAQYGTGSSIPFGTNARWVTWGANLRSDVYADIYIDGKFDVTTADFGTWSTSVAGPLTFLTAGKLLSTGDKVSFIIIFNSNLSAAEHAAFAANPWQILEPRTVYLPTYTATATTYGVVPKRVPWTSKPPVDVEVDWSNPLTKGLEHLWVQVGPHVVDLVTKTFGTLAGASYDVGRHGPKVKRTTAYGTHSVTTNVAPKASLSSGDKSAFALINTGAAAGDTTRSCIGLGDSTTNAGWSLLSMSTTMRVALAYRGVGTTFSTLTLNADTDYLIGFSHNDTASETTFFRDAASETVADTLDPLATGTKIRLLGLDISGAITYSGGVGHAFYSGGVWDRALTKHEWLAFYQNIYQLLKPRTVWLPTATAGGAGAQTLTPSLFDNSGNETFYAPTVTPGAVSLYPSLFDNSGNETFYAPTVAPGAVTLTPSLFDNSGNETFYAPTVTPGAVTLTPALFDNSGNETFYAPTVTPTYELTPALFDNSGNETFYAPTVSVGAVTLEAGLFDASGQEVFYSHLLTGGEPPTDTPKGGFIINVGKLWSR